MRVLFLSLLLWLVSTTAAPLAVMAQQESTKKKQRGIGLYDATESDSLRSAMLGMWAFAGPPGTDATPLPGAEMKCWGAGHFFVTKRDPTTNEVTYHHGGTYTLDGSRYTEKVLYTTQRNKSIVGQEFSFNIEVNGDNYIQRGIGNPYSQQWKRLTGKDDIDVLAVSPKDDEVAPSMEIPDRATVEELFGMLDRLASGPSVGSKVGNKEYLLSISNKLIEILDRILTKATDDASITRAAKIRSSVLMRLIYQDTERSAQHRDRMEQQAGNDNALIAMPAARLLLTCQAIDSKPIDLNEAEELSQKVRRLTEKTEINSDAIEMVETVSQILASDGHGEIGASLLTELADRAVASNNPKVQRTAAGIRATAVRVNLIGNPINVAGKLASGEEIQWDDYRGKVVLIDFWASWCGPCVGEFPNIKKNLEKYESAGFVVLGVNMDDRRKDMDDAVKQFDIPWENLFEGEEGKTGRNHPLVVRYGITGIPATILVGRDGNVVSLRARGEGLDNQLAELFSDVSTNQ